MNRTRATCCALGVLISISSNARGHQPAEPLPLSSPASSGDSAHESFASSPAWLVDLSARISDLESRMRSLDPVDEASANRAERAFLLAEDVASVTRSPEGMDLARTLYLHAYAWAGVPGATGSVPSDRLRAAAVLGMVELETVASTRRWLTGIARALDASLQTRDWTRPVQATRVDPARYDAARVLGLVRAGRGDSAASLLNLATVRDILAREGSIVYGLSGSGNLLGTLDREAAIWPCTRCRNARIVRLDESQNVVVCPACLGNPGPELSLSERIGWLSLESRLLERSQLSWAAQLAADLGEPLREPDADSLLARMKYNPAATQWTGRAFEVPTDPTE